VSVKRRSAWYFSSTVVAAAVSFGTVPLTTRILGPHDYGVYAFVLLLAGLGGPLSTLGTTYLISNRWPAASEDERAELITTLVVEGIAIALCWSAASAAVYWGLHDHLRVLRELPQTGVLLALAATVLAPLPIVAADVLTVQGRAAYASIMGTAATVGTAVATLIALFAFDQKGISLFIGMFVGSLISTLAAARALRVGRRYDAGLRAQLGRRTFFLAQASDFAYPMVERTLLTQFGGFAQLGLYTHAQRYRSVVFDGAKAVARGVWPTTLTEAREQNGSFAVTRRVWTSIHVGVAVVAVWATSFGDAFISLLTNDRFTGAWLYLGPWFALLLLQLTAKPETGVVFAYASGRATARLGLIANLGGLVAAAALIPFFGAYGALGAAGVQAFGYRAGARILALRYRPTPFQDLYALVAIGIVAVVYTLKLTVLAGGSGRLPLALGGTVACLVVGGSVTREVARSLLASVRARLPVPQSR
jgi:O-antigen/teichoic acid export membrane protein